MFSKLFHMISITWSYSFTQFCSQIRGHSIANTQGELIFILHIIYIFPSMPTSHDGSIFSWLPGKCDPQPLIVSFFQTSPSTRFSTRATQLELFARSVWIPCDRTPVDRAGADHRGVGEPLGRGGPHHEPSVRALAVQHH